jgi:hypothetical protein
MWGEVSAEEFLRSTAAVQNNPRYDHLLYVVNDFLQGSALQFSKSELEYIGALRIGASMSNPIVRIVILTTDAKILGFIRVYSEMTGCEVNCFETMAQAHAWIAANEVAAA